MNRITNTIVYALVITALCAVLSACSNYMEENQASDLKTAFLTPSEAAKPWVYWYWMDANATSEGITRDLEAMAETGVGGAILMPIGNAGPLTIVDPPANALSEDWWKLVVHATKEADRLGMRLAMNACDGWALAGGPWITPEMSMQELVMTEQIIDGGKPFEGKLAQPTSRENYYRDITVLALPVADDYGVTSTQLKPRATTNIEGLNPQALVTGASGLVRLSSAGWIQYEFEKPFTCRSITIWPDIRTVYQLQRAELLVSDDGKDFRSLGRLTPSEFHGWQDTGLSATHSIEPTTAKFFRFVIDPSGVRPHSENHEGSKARNRNRLAAQQIELSSQPRINEWEGKAGYRWRRSEWTSDKQCPDDLCVPLDEVINITDKMDSDGSLNWDVPEGRWLVQRIGYTSTGVKNAPAGTGAGLECDKFNPEAAKIQFDGWFGKALDRVGPELAGKTLWRNHTDSWEAFSQNWSPLFRDEFIKRRGYDPLLWLPAMSGVPIESAELSERFLYDIRRTIADLVCDNFYDPITRLGREQGATFSAECIAPTMMSDGLQHFKYADLPMGEFWLSGVNQDKPNDIQDAISGGHIYGKKIIGAEAFTQLSITWNEDPYYLKPMGDYNFARGINKFVLHVWAHQAFKKEPGVTLSRIGTFFSGNQTWHKPGKAWFDYIRRCSAMLQQGLPVVDACYFIGEELPDRSFLRKDLPVPLPEGYSYDCINRDALLTRATAKNGRMVLPDGISYRMLVLPRTDHMTPELAEKIGELAIAGVPVLGNLPNQSISLTDYPNCDGKVKKIVGKLWKSVRHNTGTQAVLDELGLLPDVEFIGVDMTPVYREKMEYFSPPLAWNHRKTREADFYFISNQDRKARIVDVAFRIKDKVPEFWDAETGKICDAGVWRQEKDRTIVSMNLSPSGSVFVVFRRSANIDPVAKITPSFENREGNLLPLWIQDGAIWASENGDWELTRQSGKTENISLEDLPGPRKISGDWIVSFTPERGAPEEINLPVLQSLSENRVNGVKYFSGTASYKSFFELSAVNEDDKVFLDLGSVANLAEVSINGKNMGVLWKPPFIIEVSDVIKPGRNELSIAVTNTWHNRIVGDSDLPEESRITWLLYNESRLGPEEDLEPAGLLGPVILRTARKIN